MRNQKGLRTHVAAPKDYRRVPDRTGSYELDAVISRNSNSDLPDRLETHLARDGIHAYAHRGAYNGYSNYGGDS